MGIQVLLLLILRQLVEILVNMLNLVEMFIEHMFLLLLELLL